jgi:hypothetical protein
MAATRTWLVPAGVLALALIGALAWFAGPERQAEPAAGPAREVVDAAEEPDEDGITDAARSERAAAAVVALTAAEAPVPDPADDGQTVTVETWILWGHVLRAADGTPAEGLLVQVYEGTSGPSDALGRFEIELDAARVARGSRRYVNVVHGNGALLSSEERTLEPGLELRIEDEVVELRGRVVDPSGAWIAVDAVSIARVDDDGVARHVGMARGVDEQGQFVVSAARHATGPGSHRVWVMYGATNFPTTAHGTALASPEGATIVLDLCPLRFEVRAADGAELEKAELRVVAWREGARDAEIHSFPVLESHGTVEVFVERGVANVEIAVGAEGYVPWIEERATPRCGETWRVELARYGPDDVLAGVVLDAAGRPVESATASCSPRARDRSMVAVPAIRLVRTDAEGRFSLPFARGSEAVLQAYHHDHGSTGDVLVVGGRRDLVLRFAASARVDVHVTAPDGTSLGAAPARFLLALADGTRHFDWGAYGRTWFEQVPAGSHRVLCLSADGDLWGLFELEVFDTQPLEWKRALGPARWVDGALVDGGGAAVAGVDVRRLDAPLDLGEEWDPFRARTGADGRFRVLLGAESEGEIAFASGGLELGRSRLAAGDAGNVQLDTLD